MVTSIVAGALVLMAVLAAGDPATPAQRSKPTSSGGKKGCRAIPATFRLPCGCRRRAMLHAFAKQASISMWDCGKDRPNSNWPN